MKEEWEPRSDWKRAVAGGLLACLGPLAIIVVCGAVLVAMFPSCEFPQLGGGVAFGDCQADTPPLHRAARAGRVDDVRMLLEAGADPNVLDANANTALGCALAVQNGPANFGEPAMPDGTPLTVVQSDAVVAILLDLGADPNLDTGQRQYREAPIGIALRRNRAHAAELLVSKGADPTRRDCRGIPLLEIATYPSTLEDLIAHGMNPNGSGGKSPAVLVAAAGNPDALRALVASGADLARPSTRWPDMTVGHEALFVAAGGISAPMVDVLLHDGGPITPLLAPRLLSAAVAGFNPANTERLLAAGLDPDVGSMTANELAALASVAPFASVAFQQPLIGTLPAPDVPPPSVSALIAAMPTPAPTQPDPDDVRLADCTEQPLTEQQDATGTYAPVSADPAATAPVPPMVIALRNVTTDDLRLLLEHGADPNIVILDRFTPLELAALDCNVEAARMLLDHGADPTLAPGGRRPVDAACPSVAALLG